MAIKYRKRIGRLELWHFHAGCPEWPEREFIQQPRLAIDEDLCDTCRDIYKIQRTSALVATLAAALDLPPKPHKD
jgi:hypothetical protein